MIDDILKELDEEFSDNADYQSLSRKEKIHIVNMLERIIDMGMAAVYGDEDKDAPDGNIDCSKYTDLCKAECCSYIFALTKEEVTAGNIQYNKERPFFIARDKEDGKCPHLDRTNWQCEIWDKRPLRCRRYDCSRDEKIRPKWL